MKKIVFVCLFIAGFFLPTHSQNSSFSDANSRKPDYSQPNANQPKYGKPDDSQPNSNQLNANQSNASRPKYGKPDVSQPNHAIPDQGKPDDNKLNDVKLNITSLFVKNFSLIYERELSRRLSVGLGVRYMSKGSLPFKNQFKKSVKSDKVNLDEFQIGNFALTPECRIYMGKGYMHGFYISVYGRYTNFDVTVPIQFTTDNGSTEQALFDGKVHSYSGGVMFGLQYTFWKVLVVDIMLIGGNYGGCSGTVSANNINPPMSAQEQQSLQKNINDIKAKPFHIKGQVLSSTQATINVSGPWAGIRSGINLGVRF